MPTQPLKEQKGIEQIELEGEDAAMRKRYEQGCGKNGVKVDMDGEKVSLQFPRKVYRTDPRKENVVLIPQKKPTEGRIWKQLLDVLERARNSFT